MRSVVFGAGQVGPGVVERLLGLGHEVRVVRRSAAPVRGAEVVTGDARDPAFAARAAAGADLVFHCMNPSAYTEAAWAAEFPAFGEALVGAAKATGAKLVVLDNLYAYGETAERRTEDAPLLATGPKGRIRAAWDRRLRSERGLRWVAGRAGDYFGPGTTGQSLLSNGVVADLAQGRAPWLIGDATAPHAFSYVPDVVAGLVALGTSDAEGVWHLPVLEVSSAELVARLAAALGVDVRPRVLPAWAVRAASPVVPLFRNLRETLYQWEGPFLASDARFRARFPGLATSLDAAVARTAAEARRAGARAGLGSGVELGGVDG